MTPYDAIAAHKRCVEKIDAEVAEYARTHKLSEAYSLAMQAYGLAGKLFIENVRLHNALESRMVEVERKGISYEGIWQRATDYQRGQVVTHDGSAWIVVADATRDAPGDGKDWQLMVKRGSSR